MVTVRTRGLIRPGILHGPFRVHSFGTQFAWQNRGFSATVRRKVGLEDAFVFLPNTILDTVHASGMIPWCVAIPTTAILIRGLLGYFLWSRPAWKRTLKRQAIVPFIYASRKSEDLFVERLITGRGIRVSGAPVTQPPSLLRWWKDLMQLHKTGKEFDAPIFNWTSPLGFVFLVSVMDTLRLKLGTTGRGVLYILLTPLQWVYDYAKSLSVPQQAFPNQVLIGENTIDATTTMSDSQQADQIEPLLSSLSPLSDNAYFDLSLRTEGFLWINDLSLPDPHWILPALFFASLSATTLLTPPVIPRRYPLFSLKHGWKLTGREKVLMSINSLIALSSTSMPVALLLYWIPSVLTGWLTNRWLRIKYPIPDQIAPCERPLRTKTETRWNN